MNQPEKPPTIEKIRDLLDVNKFGAAMQDPELTAILKEIDEEYPYWDKFKRKVPSDKYSSEMIWFLNTLTRDRSAYKFSIHEGKSFEFKYNVTHKMQRFLHQFDMHLGGLMEGSSIIPEEDKTRYLISSIMEEAIASSQLEGAATTREIAKEMLRSKRKPRNHSEKMILNNYLTIQKVISIKDRPLTKELILELHATISNNTLENSENEGHFRQNDKVDVVDGITGEVFYHPPSHELLEELMDRFCRFANTDDEKYFMHPIIKGILLHFLIGYIHPFADGNGRTARALFYWYLISKGYWLVEYMSISKVIIKAASQYARAYLYSEYDHNDLTYFIDFNLKSMDLALQSLQKYIQEKIKEKQSLYQLIKKEDINERQAEIVKRLINDSRKSFTINEVQNIFGVVYQTARTDLLQLVTLGYLTEKRMGKKIIFFPDSELENKLKVK